MQYGWDDFRLDREGTLLTHQGKQVDVSRKVLDCISHLVEHRHRVVSYDELIRKLWGHDNVTNHQLTQIVVAARRAVGDDGQSQRIIRTLSGLGYRWVGQVTEGDGIPEQTRTAATSADVVPRPAASGVQSTGAAVARRRGSWLGLAIALALAAVGLLVAQHAGRRTTLAPDTTVASSADGISGLWEALWKGRFEAVSRGLLALPDDVADSPDARLLEIRLDIERGQFDRAARKLALQQTRAVAAADPVWQAKLLTTQAFMNGASGKSGAEVLAPAESAVRLMESSGSDARTAEMGQALAARGYGLMKSSRFELAIRDLSLARSILIRAGDSRSAAEAADTLARIHMKTGRFGDALDLMSEIAIFSRDADNPVLEIYARNAETKILIELLRWEEALVSSDRSLRLLQSVPDSERRTRVLQLRALAFAGVGRLQDASALMSEADALHDKRYSTIAAATCHLAAGDLDKAMTAASEAQTFDAYGSNDTLNLESREGALLLWLIAAQRGAPDGVSIPTLSAAQRRILENPVSSIGYIARGRWLMSQRRPDDAETAFRTAFNQARQMGHLSRMLASSEPLLESLLLRGDTMAAELALAELWGYAPQQLTRDHRANLLALRVALAAGDVAAARQAYRDATTTAGERTIPPQLETGYRGLIGDRRSGETAPGRPEE
jgi:DNA-binding winged helix-turn-helix (wHTH) protein/tetratricopeptide (TPR) repeat protein